MPLGLVSPVQSPWTYGEPAVSPLGGGFVASKVVPFQAPPHMLIQVPSGFETLASVAVGPKWMSLAARLLAAHNSKIAPEKSATDRQPLSGAFTRAAKGDLTCRRIEFVQGVFISGSFFGD